MGNPNSPEERVDSNQDDIDPKRIKTSEDSDADPVNEIQAGKVDFDRLKPALSLKISPDNLNIDLSKDKPLSDKDLNIPEVLEEMAEDMLHLLERLSAVEKQLTGLTNIVSNLQELQNQNYRKHTVDLEKLKEELISERKAFIARSTFNSILPAIESLGLIKDALDKEKDSIAYNQMSAVLDILNNILQSLGYISFSSIPGDIFDPSCMDCLGFSEGEEGTVVRVERAGYKAGNIIVKPCGVILGKQA